MRDPGSTLIFHKLHGAANDFVVLDGRGPAARDDWGTLARRMCDRRRGVGADGILVVEDSADADYRMRYHNADGSEAEMCGNGVRCIAKFVIDTGITERKDLEWTTGAGPVRTEVLEHAGSLATVRVDMGPPRMSAQDVPVTSADTEVRDLPFEVGGESLALTCLSMGNPHAVTFVDSVAGYPLERVGPMVEQHDRFPERANFEIVEMVSKDRVKVRVWERGVGETQACGTGACAVAVAAQLVRGAASELAVELPGGVLQVSWRPGENAMLTGPAETAFVGEFRL